MFSFIYEGEYHTDISTEFMTSLGMNNDQISSVLQQMKFESSRVASKRLSAYTLESDPLHAEWQYELATGNAEANTYKQAWLNKVSEIKLRHPLAD